MKKILTAVLVLAAAPAVLAAQHHPNPVPLPVDTTSALPDVAPRIFPQGTSRTEDALAGALEGALAGTVYALVIKETRPGCAPSTSVRETALTGAASGALWGGLRGLLGIRGRRGRVRTDLPEPDARAVPSGSYPLSGGRCGDFPNGAFPDLVVRTASAAPDTR